MDFHSTFPPPPTHIPGFIAMTPQLFINYKLKSVAHLPWRMLTYKALNTFIDDLFAFVIKMPTLYRLGVFRDGEGVAYFIAPSLRTIYTPKRSTQMCYTITPQPSIIMSTITPQHSIIMSTYM